MGGTGKKEFNSSTQGLYFCAPDGTLLSWTNNRSPERFKQTLAKATSSFQAADVSLLSNPTPDKEFVFEPPKGGLVVTVTSRVVEGHAKGPDGEKGAFEESLGRDLLWVRADEHAALARGEMPRTLAVRLARFNLIDNTRGEPAPWSPEEVRSVELTLKDGVLTGTAHVESKDGRAGYKAELRGVVESKEGQVIRLDVVALGEAWGFRGVTANSAPKGRFQLAVGCRLASGQDAADRVMPQGAKSWLPDYLK